MPIKVVLADDDDDCRRLLRVAFELDGRFRVVGEASNGPQTVTLTGANHPDVLVLDFMMPGMNGAEVLSQVRKKSPETKVVIYSAASVNATRLLTGMAADAYLGKTPILQDLTDQVAAVMVG